jgi:SAM-dependent methyltransferase
MTDESSIASHYAHDHLYETIIKALASAGITADRITPKELAPVDEFHVRGQQISRELAVTAGLQPGMRVLDVGCGLGGACRLLADEYGCDVTGIDITPDYIETAVKLSALTGLQHKTRFVPGSALALPFDNNSFDVVWTQHVQMNIADKNAFYSEIKRVLTTTGRFVYYDILSAHHAPIHFPVPWATDATLSHLMTAPGLHTLLQEMGWQRVQVTDETAKGIAFFDTLLNRITQKGLPALGLHLLMGGNALEKLQNLRTNLVEGRLVLESGVYDNFSRS